MKHSVCLPALLFACCVAGATPVATAEPLARLDVGGVSYMSGGVGEDERAAMRAVASDYNVALVFADTASGAYLADVAVDIRNASGATMLKAVSEGPWLYARLPVGRYKVSARVGGTVLARTVAVGAKGRATAIFRFP